MRGKRLRLLALILFLLPVLPLMATIWAPSVTISPSITAQSAGFPQVSMNLSGNAIAVWERFNGIVVVIESATFNGSTWSSSVVISPSSIAGQNANSPQVSMNASGNAVAVWQRANGTATVVESATFNGSSWNSSVTISPSVAGQNASIPQVSMNDSGKAVAVWTRNNGTATVVESANFNGSSWSSFVTISPSVAGQNALNSQVSMNASGNAIAVWSRNNGTTDVIESATFNGSTWSSPVTISLSIAGRPSFTPQVSLNASGKAIAVWARANGTTNVIESATFNGSSWSSSVLISPSISGQPAALPQVSLNANGNAVAVWQRTNAITQVIESATFNGSSWSSSVTISPSLSGQNASSSQVSMNDSNTAVAVWQRTNGIAQVIESSTFNGSIWDPTVFISPSIAGQNASNPQVSLNNSGNAIAIWQRNNGTTTVIEATNSIAPSHSSSGGGCNRCNRCSGRNR